LKQLPHIPYKSVGVALILMVLAFVGGQVTPQIVPATWSVGQSKLDFNDLNDTYQLLKSKYDGTIDPNKVMDGARAGVVSSTGDPYTVYLTAQQAKSLNDQLSGTLSGVGVEVGIKDNKLTVIAPVAGTPAAKAGLRSSDIIAGINHQDSSTLTLDDAVAKIRGPKGTKVTLTILRGSSAPQDITITRDVISVPSVTWSMKADASGTNTIGYINITEYNKDTSAKIAQAASELKSQGAKSIILDVRDNPGGYLDAAVATVTQFTKAGSVVVDERHNGQSIDKLRTQNDGPLVGLPVVVLMNSGSASASEITAGALHDNIGARLIGGQSFGKGSVQEIEQLAGGAELKVTIAHWFTPSGKGIDKVGLKPDIKVDKNQADVDTGRDPQLDKAIQVVSS